MKECTSQALPVAFRLDDQPADSCLKAVEAGDVTLGKQALAPKMPAGERKDHEAQAIDQTVGEQAANEGDAADGSERIDDTSEVSSAMIHCPLVA